MTGITEYSYRTHTIRVMENEHGGFFVGYVGRDGRIASLRVRMTKQDKASFYDAQQFLDAWAAKKGLAKVAQY